MWSCSHPFLYYYFSLSIVWGEQFKTQSNVLHDSFLQPFSSFNLQPVSILTSILTSDIVYKGAILIGRWPLKLSTALLQNRRCCINFSTFYVFLKKREMWFIASPVEASSDAHVPMYIFMNLKLILSPFADFSWHFISCMFSFSSHFSYLTFEFFGPHLSPLHEYT